MDVRIYYEIWSVLRTHTQCHADVVVLRGRVFKVAGVGEELPEPGQLFAGLHQLVMEFQGRKQQPIVQQSFGYVAVARGAAGGPVLLGHSRRIPTTPRYYGFAAMWIRAGTMPSATRKIIDEKSTTGSGRGTENETKRIQNDIIIIARTLSNQQRVLRGGRQCRPFWTMITSAVGQTAARAGRSAMTIFLTICTLGNATAAALGGCGGMQPAHRVNGLITIAGPGSIGRGVGGRAMSVADSVVYRWLFRWWGRSAATLSQTESDRPPPQRAHVTQHDA